MNDITTSIVALLLSAIESAIAMPDVVSAMLAANGIANNVLRFILMLLELNYDIFKV
jgi:hypothetical protein